MSSSAGSSEPKRSPLAGLLKSGVHGSVKLRKVVTEEKHLADVLPLEAGSLEPKPPCVRPQEDEEQEHVTSTSTLSMEEWYTRTFTPLLTKSRAIGGEAQRRHNEWVASFDIEQWYPRVEQMTFATRFVKMTRKHAHALIALHSAFHQWATERMAAATVETIESFDSDEQLEVEWIRGQSEQLAILSDLMEGISTAIAYVNSAKKDTTDTVESDEKKAERRDASGECAVFVKLSSRSPKDAAIGRVVAFMRDALTNEKSALFVDTMARVSSGALKLRSLPNAVVAHLLQCQIDAMRLDATEECALKCVLSMAKSKRCAEDLHICLKQEVFEQSAVVREWVSLKAAHEFRAFVCGNQLTAVCQYNHLCQFPELKSNGDAIVDQISHFWLTECSALLDGVFEDNTYIIDFAKVGDSKLVVIELNPFETDTDALLFDWRRDAPLLCGAHFPHPIRDASLPPVVSSTVAFKHLKYEFCFGDSWKLLPQFRTVIDEYFETFETRVKTQLKAKKT